MADETRDRLVRLLSRASAAVSDLECAIDDVRSAVERPQREASIEGSPDQVRCRLRAKSLTELLRFTSEHTTDEDLSAELLERAAGLEVL